MSAGGHSCPDISHSQLQSELVCKGQDTVFIFFVIICIYYASVYIHSVKSARYSKLIRAQTRSPSLPKKTKQICFPVQRVQFYLSDAADPNIMHFPSPENLHAAQQTDKYLIGQPSVPHQPWQQPEWAWERHRMRVPCQFLGIKALWGTKSALLTCERLSGWCWRRLFAWLRAAHRCQGITDE